jgi:hypothetical protein
MIFLALSLLLLWETSEAFSVETRVRLGQHHRRILVPLKTSLEEDLLGIENGHRWISPEHCEICSETGLTLSRFMREMARANPELEEIESIFTALQTATKTISNLVRKCDLTGTTGLQGNVNIQGEEQKKLDVITNEVLKNALKWAGHLGTLASEEEDNIIMVDNRGNKVYSGNVLIEQEGQYIAVFDPLDGSSNVDANIPVGTIFGIFRNDDECTIADEDPDQVLDAEERRCLQNTLQPGRILSPPDTASTRALLLSYLRLAMAWMATLWTKALVNIP